MCVLVGRIAFVLALGCSLVLSASEKIARVTDWCINEPGAPIHIKTFENGIELLNISDQTVTGYRLGCVATSDKTSEVVFSFEWKDTELKAGDSLSMGPIDGVSKEKLECTIKRNGRLAVLDVNLAGRKPWHTAIPDQSKTRPNSHPTP